MEPDIKVTRIKNRFHARCYLNGNVVDEMACKEKEDIGVICHIMFRWIHKLGIHVSKYTDSARHRQSNQRTPKGKIWYKVDLDKERR